MATDPAEPAKPDPPAGPLSALGGDAGCVMFGVPITAAGAAVYIFDSAVKAGAAWAGAAASAALALMAFGVVWVLARSRG